MEYNHSKKAGNRGDVWKHSFLVALADVIPASGDSFRWVECHAGAPKHELIAGAEWERGIGDALRRGDGVSPYLTRAGEFVSRAHYPAGWVFVAERLAKRFTKVEMRLFDTSEEIARRYRSKVKTVPANVKRRFSQTDGVAYARRRGSADLVFMDPPYADWSYLAACCSQLFIKGVPFVAWYPFYWPTKPQQLVEATGCVAWEVAWAGCGDRPSRNLKGCGMLVSPQLVSVLADLEKPLFQTAQPLAGTLVLRRPEGGGRARG